MFAGCPLGIHLYFCRRRCFHDTKGAGTNMQLRFLLSSHAREALRHRGMRTTALLPSVSLGVHFKPKAHSHGLCVPETL